MRHSRSSLTRLRTVSILTILMLLSACSTRPCAQKEPCRITPPVVPTPEDQLTEETAEAIANSVCDWAVECREEADAFFGVNSLEICPGNQ